MTPHELERLVLGACLSHPNGNDNIPLKIVTELDVSRFITPVNQKVFNGIKKCVYKRIPATPLNVGFEMGASDLEACGSMEYLEENARFPASWGIFDKSSIPDLVRRLDIQGRGAALFLIQERNTQGTLDDFLRRLASVEDPEGLLFDIATQITATLGGSSSGYRPFSEAVDEAILRLKKASKGEVTSIIPMGWPNLEKYCIPRPRSFGVLAGISSMGKTQFALQILYGVALNLKKKNEKGKVAINTFEQSGSDLASRLGQMISRVNSHDVARADITKEQFDRLMINYEMLRELPIIFSDDPTLNSNQIILQAISDEGPRILGVTDYVELVTDNGESEELRVSQITRNLRKICWHTHSCEMMLSQVNDNALKNYGVGGMFSSRYSRAPAHAADWYIELVNYPQMNRSNLKVGTPDGRNSELAYAIIEKNKNYSVGEEPFEWTPEYTLFRDMSLPMGKIYADIKEDDF